MLGQLQNSRSIGIVTLPVSEWRAYKEARLRALSEDPQAFARTYVESAALPDEMWQARLQSVADGREWLFFACFDGEIVGMMGAYRPKDVEGTAVIWGVHVDRAQRGQGIGGKLMARLLDELRRAGIERVMLTVSREQAAAVGLYKKFGFAVVGDGREHIEYVMERDLQYGSMLRSPNTTYQGGRGQEQRQLDALAYDGEKGDGEQRPSARSRDM